MDHKLQFFYRRTKKYLLAQTVLDNEPADFPVSIPICLPRHKRSKKKILQLTAIVELP